MRRLSVFSAAVAVWGLCAFVGLSAAQAVSDAGGRVFGAIGGISERAAAIAG